MTDAGAPVRFLGLALDERNRRVLSRSGRLDGRLELPAGVAITPALAAALPSEPGVWHLVWDATRPPVVWTIGAAGAVGTATVVEAPAGAALDVSTRAARRRSAWRLLKASGKPTDGWMSRHVHRKVSRLCTAVALEAGVSANTATLATFALGLASAGLFAGTGRVSMALGGLLFWLTSMADGVDGEIARLTFTESDSGQQLDTVVDDLTYASCYAGATVGWWRQGMGARGALLVAGTLGALVAAVMWATRIVKRSGPGGTGRFVPLTPIELAVVDAAAATRKAPLRIAAGLFQIFRRELFSIALCAVSLSTGRRAVLPVVIAGGLAAAVAVLAAYRGDIEAAMQRRYGVTGGTRG